MRYTRKSHMKNYQAHELANIPIFLFLISNILDSNKIIGHSSRSYTIMAYPWR